MTSRVVPLNDGSIEILMRFFRHNGLFLALLLVAVAVYTIFVLPWLSDSGHVGLSIPGYAIFALLLVYGRADRLRRRSRPRRNSKAA